MPDNRDALQAYAFEWFAQGWLAVINEIVELHDNQGMTYEEAVEQLRKEMEAPDKINAIKEEEN